MAHNRRQHNYWTLELILNLCWKSLWINTHPSHMLDSRLIDIIEFTPHLSHYRAMPLKINLTLQLWRKWVSCGVTCCRPATQEPLGLHNTPAAQRLDLFAWCVRLSRLLVGFRTHFKSLHFHSFSCWNIIQQTTRRRRWCQLCLCVFVYQLIPL